MLQDDKSNLGQILTARVLATGVPSCLNPSDGSAVHKCVVADHRTSGDHHLKLGAASVADGFIDLIMTSGAYASAGEVV